MAEQTNTGPRFGSWLTLTLTTLLLLGAAEVGIRFVPPDISVLGDMILLVDEPVGYRMKPNLDVQFEGLFEPLPAPVRWQTNGQGHRRTGPISETTNRCRIASFGDSETFGWSVAIEDTFQARLEAAGNDLQVLNFGVPGYNTTNVALAMADLVPRYRPDVVIYLFNKNDFDPPIEVAATFFRSHLLGRVRYVWQIWVTRDERKRIRESVERKMVAVRDLSLMAEASAAEGATLIIAFMRWRNWQELRPYLDAAHPLIRQMSAGKAEIVNAEPALADIADLDDHLAPAAYRNLAALLSNAPASCNPAFAARGLSGF